MPFLAPVSGIVPSTLGQTALKGSSSCGSNVSQGPEMATDSHVFTQPSFRRRRRPPARSCSTLSLRRPMLPGGPFPSSPTFRLIAACKVSSAFSTLPSMPSARSTMPSPASRPRSATCRKRSRRGSTALRRARSRSRRRGCSRRVTVSSWYPRKATSASTSRRSWRISRAGSCGSSPIWCVGQVLASISRLLPRSNHILLTGRPTRVAYFHCDPARVDAKRIGSSTLSSLGRFGPIPCLLRPLRHSNTAERNSALERHGSGSVTSACRSEGHLGVPEARFPPVRVVASSAAISQAGPASNELGLGRRDDGTTRRCAREEASRRTREEAHGRHVAAVWPPTGGDHCVRPASLTALFPVPHS